MTMLAYLSIQRCPQGCLPEAPSNEERYRALLAALPVHLGNTRFSFGDKQRDDSVECDEADLGLMLPA